MLEAVEETEETEGMLHPYAACAVVLRSSPKGTEILLLKRSPEAQTLPGLWNCPGGRVEDYEYPHRAMIRELEEEAGLSVVSFHKMTTLLGTITNKLVAYYQVSAGPEEVVLNEEHTEARWFLLDEIDRENTVPLGAAIVDLLLSSGDLGKVNVVRTENEALKKQVELMAKRLRAFGAEPEYVDPRDYAYTTQSGPPALKVVFVFQDGEWTFNKVASIKYGRQVRKLSSMGEVVQALRPIVAKTGLPWVSGATFIQELHTVLLANGSGIVDFDPNVMQCMIELDGRLICVGTLADVARYKSQMTG